MRVSIRKLEKPEWSGYFSFLSKGALLGKRAAVEIASLNIGAQVEADWVLLFGVAYDEKDDVLEITLDGLDHLIRQPLEIHVDEGESILSSFAVLDYGGHRHIVRLRDPLMLPPPLRH